MSLHERPSPLHTPHTSRRDEDPNTLSQPAICIEINIVFIRDVYTIKHHYTINIYISSCFLYDKHFESPAFCFLDNYSGMLISILMSVAIPT
jgi:hypothetical protein